LEKNIDSALNVVASPDGSKIQAMGMPSLDGEYILLVQGGMGTSRIEAEGRIGKEPLE